MSFDSTFGWDKEKYPSGSISGKAFLDSFASEVKDRDKRTSAAQQEGQANTSSITDSKKEKGSTPGMSKIAPDVTVQQGYKGSEFTLAGTPAKKGFGGTLIRAGGALLAPVTGGASIPISSAAASASGADYW